MASQVSTLDHANPATLDHALAVIALGPDDPAWASRYTAIDQYLDGYEPQVPGLADINALDNHREQALAMTAAWRTEHRI
ncbi:MAG: hypothetical protein ACK5MT_09005 [Actinomycetales bacterium]